MSVFPLIVIRLGVWAFIGLPSIRQIHAYITDPNCKRIGNHTFLSLCILITEVLLIWKHSGDEFPEPMSDNVKLGAIAYGVFHLVAFIVLTIRIKTHQHDDKESKDN